MDVDTCSEDYRELCEARYVINLKNKTARNHYIGLVRKHRGDKMANRLIARVEEIWSKQKDDRKK